MNRFVSGLGQYHSEKNGTPYELLSWSQVQEFVDNPQQVDKKYARWIIPSCVLSRSAEEQRQKGQYSMLWFDFDEASKTLEEIAEITNKIGAAYELYTSRSATELTQKCRLLIPLKSQASFTDWHFMQKTINDWFDKHGVKPDRANKKANQLCYLPNKGTYYKAIHKRHGEALTPFRAIEPMTDISMFNSIYKVEDILQAALYRHDGKNNWRHPESESGSYSASVKDGRVFTLSDSDPLANKDGKAHDAFSAYETLFGKIENKSKAVTLDQFSITGRSKEMRLNMLQERHALKDLAIVGQWTTFYAAPNTGKTLLTLWLLVEQVKDNVIQGQNVYYVNADDGYKGAVEKLEIAETVNINVLTPNENGFKTSILVELLQRMAETKDAKNKIVVLDTLKKFTDPMDKKKSSYFGNVCRQFVLAGGTIICLAHTNKRKANDGSSIHGGTSDIIDDCDCAYIIEQLGSDTAEFVNIKARGNVADRAAFKYSNEKKDYYELFDSVQRLGETERRYEKQKSDIQSKKERDLELINAIVEFIGEEEKLKGDVVEHIYSLGLSTKQRIVSVLDKWDNVAGGNWQSRKGDRNSILYRKQISFF